MMALGEMSTKYPSKKGFAGHATRCVDPAFGFATALVYLCKYLIICRSPLLSCSGTGRLGRSGMTGSIGRYWMSLEHEARSHRIQH